MFPLFETIKIQDGQPQNLSWHQERFERSYGQFYDRSPGVVIQQMLSVPFAFSQGIVKCRFKYNNWEFVFSFQHYQPKRIDTLKIVHDNEIDYSLKYTNRNALENLLQQRAACDDIIIVKNGLITDSSYSNLVFYDGNRWITPAEPLLTGTKRALLLADGIIEADVIRVKDLDAFSSLKLINAMLDFEEQPAIDIAAIKF